MPEPTIPADPQGRAAWLQERREYCDKATPGPWAWDTYNTVAAGSGEDYRFILRILDHPQDGEYAPGQSAERGRWYKESESNATFAASARTDLPLLLDEIARLDAENSYRRGFSGGEIISAVRDVLMEEFAWVSIDGVMLQSSAAESLGRRVVGLLEDSETPKSNR